MFAVGLTHYLVLSAMLAGLGILVMVTKRNAIGILIGVELVLNAGNLNWAAFARYQVGDSAGVIAALFGVVLAAAEAAVAIAVFVNMYNNLATVDVDRASELSG